MKTSLPVSIISVAEEGVDIPVIEEAPLVGMEFMIDGEDATEFTGEEPFTSSQDGHDANLAESMEERDLDEIAEQVLEWVETDIASRQEWHDRLAKGVKSVGVVDDRASNPSDNACWALVDHVNHPLIAEACVQFQARAITELVPPGGPVKTTVMGAKDKDTIEQAVRVQDFMNYNLMHENEDYFPETDAMLFVLALEGSQFKKTYHDSITDSTLSAHIRPQYFVVPYNAKSLKKSSRYTHIIPTSQNDMRKYVASGFYRDVELSDPSGQTMNNEMITEAEDEAQGRNYNIDVGEDAEHVRIECHCDYVLDPEGDDDIALPYVITIDKESVKVLSIRRNWEEDDINKEKVVSFVHFPYIPGDGFYSYGLLHLIGGLGVAATGLLKTILLGAAFSAMRGGFKSKDAKLPGNVSLRFGEYIDTELSAEDLSKAFFEPNFKEPGESIFKIMQFVTEMGQRFSSTSETMVGDGSNTGPVGTTVALIEQGSKVFAGTHKRLHYAQGQEFKQLARLHGKHLPDHGYPYKVAGADRTVYSKDFDSRVDVIPVSDPNIFSSTQRIAQAQALRQMADTKPNMYNHIEVERRMLNALRVPEVEELLIDPSKTRRRDPISENMCMMGGIPVMVFQDQDHDAHSAVCQDMIQRIMANPDPAMKDLLPAFYAHLAQHVAYAMRGRYAQAMGMVLPPFNFMQEADLSDDTNQEIDPALDNEISTMAANAITKLPKPPEIPSPQLEEIAKNLQAKEIELGKKEKQLQSALGIVETEGKKLNAAKKEVDRIQDKIKYEEQLEDIRRDLRLVQIEKAEVQSKLDVEVKKRIVEKVHDHAVDEVKTALDKRNKEQDRKELQKEKVAQSPKPVQSPNPANKGK